MYEWSAQCFVCHKVDARDEMILILGDETSGMYRCKACDEKMEEEILAAEAAQEEAATSVWK